jgi:small subunit ribosomal protein S5
LVESNRVSKVVKGGKKFRIAARVIVGDRKGLLGFSSGKAKEPGIAAKKAIQRARRYVHTYPIRQHRTFHHDVEAKFGSCRVMIRAAPEGTGLIAGGAMRLVFETLGVRDVVAKVVKKGSAANVVRATLEALKKLQSPKHISLLRKIPLHEFMQKTLNKSEIHTKKEPV